MASWCDAHISLKNKLRAANYDFTEENGAFKIGSTRVAVAPPARNEKEIADAIQPLRYMIIVKFRGIDILDIIDTFEELLECINEVVQYERGVKLLDMIQERVRDRVPRALDAGEQ